MSSKRDRNACSKIRNLSLCTVCAALRNVQALPGCLFLPGAAALVSEDLAGLCVLRDKSPILSSQLRTQLSVHVRVM